MQSLERRVLFCLALAVGACAALLAGCTASSPEIGNSGVTVDELEEAAEAFEDSLDADETIADTNDGVLVQVTVCDVIDVETNPGTRRRTWVRAENGNPEPTIVTVVVNFVDGGSAGDSYEIEGAAGGEPGVAFFAFNEDVEVDVPEGGDACTKDVVDIELVEAKPAG